MSVRKILSKQLFHAKPVWWLDSKYHFSFMEYHNKDNIRFGTMRVMNDDVIQPKAGFETHGHKDMEIVSYVVKGELTHKDSTGNMETLTRGSVQYMSAGTGITHSEMNNHETDIVRLIQIWIKPDQRGYAPNYGSKTYDPEERHNKLLHIISSKASANEKIIGFNQDSNIYVSELDPGKKLNFQVKPDRQAYLLCVEGKLDINEGKETLEEADAMEIYGSLELALKAPKTEKGHLLIVEMPKPVQ